MDLPELFSLLNKIPHITHIDPRRGCIERTQIVGSLLHNMGLQVRRIWVLPIYEGVSFFAPLYDKRGKPLRVALTPENKGRHVRWRYHCASVLVDVPGQPVLDLPLFTGPVRLGAWKQVLLRAQQDCAAGPDVELRFVVHDFQHIPERQVLRHNRYALKQSAFLPDHRLAQMTSFVPVIEPDEKMPFKRHAGDGRIRRALSGT